MPQLREILRDPSAFDPSYALFTVRSDIGLDSDCLILDPDDVEDIDDVPDQARERGYDYVLMMDDVNSIIANLTAQVETPADELRLEALKFYLTRDAFIVA